MCQYLSGTPKMVSSPNIFNLIFAFLVFIKEFAEIIGFMVLLLTYSRQRLQISYKTNIL
jgi:hypothetical protein